MCFGGDLLLPVNAFRHALRHVGRWMRVENRKADFPFNLVGARHKQYGGP
jgi:hypothetical protein